jgi:hypothetical protein
MLVVLEIYIYKFAYDTDNYYKKNLCKKNLFHLYLHTVTGEEVNYY